MRTRHLFAVVLFTALAVTPLRSVVAQGGAPDVAPAGKLRVAMIGNNPVLVTKKADGSISGVSADMGNFIAQKLGVAFEPVVYADPAAYTKSFGSGEWDIAIGPRESSTAGGLGVSPDFMVVENLFVVAPGKAIRSAGEVDRPGVRIIVAQDGAPDKYLTPRIKAAELVRTSASTNAVVDMFRSGKGDVYVSNAVAVFQVADAMPGTKVLADPLTVVPMAVAVQKGRSAAALETISAIVAEAKLAGLPQKAIDKANLRGVKVVTK